MNKYTLRFNDECLNYLYDKQNEKKLLEFRILSVVNLAAMIVGLSDVLGNLPFHFQEDITISISITIFCFLDQLIVYKFRQYTHIGLFMTNMALLCVQLEIQPHNNGFIGYLLGSNQMLVHTVIIFVSPYYFALFTNIILCVSRLLITYYNTDDIGIGFYAYTFFVLCFFMIILYHIEKDKKNQFLLHLKDSTLEAIYPKIICKPFYVFTLDKNSMQLKQKLIQQHEVIQFTDLINLGLVKSILLKHFIYQQIKLFSTLQTSHYSHSFITILEGKRQMATFSAFKLDQNYFVLTIDSLDKNVQTTELKNSKLQEKQKANFKKIINQVGRITHKIMIERNLDLGVKLRLSLLQIQYSIYTAQNPIYLEQFDIQNQLRKIIQYSKLLGYSMVCIAGNPVQVYNSKSYFTYLIIEIIKSLHRKQFIKFRILVEGKKVLLKIDGMKKQPTTKVYLVCCNALIKSIEIIDNVWHYNFYEEPLVSFYKIQQIMF